MPGLLTESKSSLMRSLTHFIPLIDVQNYEDFEHVLSVSGHKWIMGCPVFIIIRNKVRNYFLRNEFSRSLKLFPLNASV